MQAASEQELEVAKRRLASLLNKVPSSAKNGSIQEAKRFKEWVVKAQKLAKKRGVKSKELDAASQEWYSMDKERLV